MKPTHPDDTLAIGGYKVREQLRRKTYQTAGKFTEKNVASHTAHPCSCEFARNINIWFDGGFGTVARPADCILGCSKLL